MKIGNRSFNFFGWTRQTIQLGSTEPRLGLPPGRDLRLPFAPLADVVTGGEPDLFEILSWRRRLVEAMHGREAELRTLLDRAKGGPASPSVQLVTGEGGAGKSRLAAEAAKQLAGAGWNAGFATRSEDSEPAPAGGKGSFIIVDYPEEQRSDLRTLLEAVRNESQGGRVRVLLLSRLPFESWQRELDELGLPTGSAALAEPGPLTPGQAITVVEEAASRLAKAMGRDRPDLGDAAAWLAADQLHRLPLYATAAAIHSVLEPAEAFALGGRDLLRALARRERRRVRPISRVAGLGEDGLARLLALAVLAGRLNEVQIARVASVDSIGQRASDVPGRVASTPWWRSGVLAALQPDPLAAAFLHETLFPIEFSNGRAALPDEIFAAVQDDSEGFVDRLGRLLADLTALAAAPPHPLESSLTRMFDTNPDRLDVFAAACCRKVPHWAAAFAATVAMRASTSKHDPAQRALLLAMVGINLRAIGRREKALRAAEEAVVLYKELSAERPEFFRSDLAMALTSLSNCLSGLGRREEALQTAREAADLYRELAVPEPDVFRSGLANALSNLANCLSELGLREEPLQAAHEAIDIHRALANQGPDAITGVAMALNNLALGFAEVGLHEEALRAAQEAADLCRRAAAQRPEEFRPALGLVLMTLAIRLSELGIREEALKVAREATDVFHDLAMQRPQAFRHNLAKALGILGNRFSELDRLEEALQAAQRAADIYRELSDQHPEAFRHDLAIALNNLATLLGHLGWQQEAWEAAREATDLFRGLSDQRPDAFRHELAISLNTLANRLAELDRRDEALEVTQEATRIFREFVVQRPDVFLPKLAMTLSDLANRLSELGRREEALQAAQEAVTIHRPLAAQRPDAFRVNLAKSLAVLGLRLVENHRGPAAVETFREAIEILAPLFKRLPQTYEGLMRNLCGNYLSLCEETDIATDEGLLGPVVQALQILDNRGG